MKRLIAAIIDTMICCTFLFFLRFLVATLQKAVYVSKNIYISGMRYELYIFMFVAPIFIIFLYQWIAYKKCRGQSLGKKIMRLNIKEQINKQYIVFRIIMKIVATYIYPITILFYFITGEMPYDRLLKNNIKKSTHMHIFTRLVAFGLILCFLFANRITFCEKTKNYYFSTPYISIYIFDRIAGLYTGVIDLPIEYIGEEAFQSDIEADAGNYIFSEEGKKRNWGIVITDRGEYLDQYASLGCKLLDINQFNFQDYFLVCSFGRKVNAARVVSGQHEDVLPPFIELSRNYDEEKIYYYRVRKIDIKYPEECQHFPERYEEIHAIEISYQDIKDDFKKVHIADDLGFLGRWLWAFRWGIEDNKDMIF